MTPFTITQLKDKNIQVRFSGSKINLPKEIQAKIDAYWQSLLDSGKQYTRGEVFTVTDVDSSDEEMTILVEKTDYAHYLYCQNVDADLAGYGVRIIHTACLVETTDGKIIFGKMGPQTARKGIYQLCGGGIDNDDLRGNLFDLDHNIQKELIEELDVDVKDNYRVEYFAKAYLKEGGPTNKMSLIYKVVLAEESSQFLEKYQRFVKELEDKKQLPEFGEIVALDENNKKKITDFFSENKDNCDEYMEPLFKYYYL